MHKKNLLLDTHIFIWLMEGSPQLSPADQTLINQSVQNHSSLFLSSISLWEIGMLVTKGRLQLKMPLAQWIHRALEAPQIELCPLTPEICIESCQLPGEFHLDPADRMIVATARILNIPLLTKDEKILSYRDKGFIEKPIYDDI